MRIDLHLHGDLARRVPAAPGQGQVELADGAPVAALAAALGLPPAAAVFVVNGAVASARHVLREGDRVRAFPASAGG